MFDIVAWTEEHFGRDQAKEYRETIFAALRELESGPNLVGVKKRSDVLCGLFSLHIARHNTIAGI